MEVKLLVLLLHSCFALNPLLPQCPEDDTYSPCSCYNLWIVKKVRLRLSCNNVAPIQLGKVMNTVIDEDQIIQELFFKNSDIEELPESFLDGATVIAVDATVPKLKKISPKAFSGQENSLERLKISQSSLESFPISTLSYLKKLREIYLQGLSNMEEVTGETFDGLETVPLIDYLALPSCGIQKIHPNAFEKFSSLQYLVLSDNQIVQFEALSLPGHKLRTLDLSGNKLTEFPIELATQLRERGWLSLARMDFEIITANQMDIIIENKCIVLLKDNPLHCGCVFKRIAQILEDSPYDNRILGDCATPKNLEGRRVPTLRLEDFEQC